MVYMITVILHGGRAVLLAKSIQTMTDRYICTKLLKTAFAAVLTIVDLCNTFFHSDTDRQIHKVKTLPAMQSVLVSTNCSHDCSCSTHYLIPFPIPLTKISELWTYFYPLILC